MRAAVVCLLAGCTFAGDGEPFARLSAELDARLIRPADRDVGDGWQKLASEYEVRLDELRLELPALELLDTGGAAAGFDPANPPAGYSLCHNGHCHAADGSLVSYEEIAAEASGGELAPVASLPVGELDLLAGEAVALDCAPSCDLPAAQIGVVRGAVASLTLGGRVRDGRSPARLDERAFSLAVDLPAGAILRGTLDLPADRRHDPDVRLSLSFAPSVALLDGVDFASRVPAGADDAIDLAPDAALVIERLLENPLGASVSRQEL